MERRSYYRYIEEYAALKCIVFELFRLGIEFDYFGLKETVVCAFLSAAIRDSAGLNRNSFIVVEFRSLGSVGY